MTEYNICEMTILVYFAIKRNIEARYGLCVNIIVQLKLFRLFHSRS